MAKRKKRRSGFGSSTWQMTERLFAKAHPRAGKGPRSCGVELRVIRTVMKRGARSRRIGSALAPLVDAWDAAAHGQCRRARKLVAKVVSKQPHLFSSPYARAVAQGWAKPKLPGASLW